MQVPRQYKPDADIIPKTLFTTISAENANKFPHEQQDLFVLLVMLILSFSNAKDFNSK